MEPTLRRPLVVARGLRLIRFPSLWQRKGRWSTGRRNILVETVRPLPPQQCSDGLMSGRYERLRSSQRGADRRIPARFAPSAASQRSQVRGHRCSFPRQIGSLSRCARKVAKALRSGSTGRASERPQPFLSWNLPQANLQRRRRHSSLAPGCSSAPERSALSTEFTSLPYVAAGRAPHCYIGSMQPRPPACLR
jgi:hypothetical protein